MHLPLKFPRKNYSDITTTLFHVSFLPSATRNVITKTMFDFATKDIFTEQINI